MNWPKEEIPDLDFVYYRVHINELSSGRIAPGVFRERGDTDDERSMSTDWSKYSTPEQAKQRARKPEENCIISLNVGKIRQIPNQTVSHNPIQNVPILDDNRAHTDVKGIDIEARAEYMLIYEWKIKLPLVAE